MRKFIIIMAWILAGFVVPAQAQQSIGERIEEEGIGWIIGHWEATDNDGNTILQSFTYDLNKHVVLSRSKNPRWEIKGMTGINPENDKAVYVGFSSRGGAVKGSWSDHDGSPLLKLKAQDSDGQTWNGGVVYKKVDAETMEVRIYGLEDNGDLKGSPGSTVTFKRTKKG